MTRHRRGPGTVPRAAPTEPNRKTGRSIGRRRFLGAAGAAGLGAAVLPRLRPRRVRAQAGFRTEHLVVVGLAGGLRLSESLGMAEGATMPNLFGRVPWIPGFGDGDAGDARIAPEVAAARRPLILPEPRRRPLAEEGALIANLRYAEGAPGHLQGQACLVSGVYNQIENRSDARAPAPTLFELRRRAAGTGSTDAWYVSGPGGFYRALQHSDDPEYGARFGGRFLSPPLLMSPVLPVAASGVRDVRIDPERLALPAIPTNDAEIEAVGRLTAILDAGQPGWEDAGARFRGTAGENAAVERHLAGFHGDPTYQSFYPPTMGIGLANGDGGIDATTDALTVYHAERVLERFQPGVMVVTLLDVDAGHADYNGYLRGQLVVDALVRHLWELIEATPGLAGETTLMVLPEHGRHLEMNGQNPDSLGRSGLDHGIGDDGDRDVFALILGPDTPPGTVVERTDVAQAGRTSGRYETIDVLRTGAELLGLGDAMQARQEAGGHRPGLVVGEVLG